MRHHAVGAPLPDTCGRAPRPAGRVGRKPQTPVRSTGNGPIAEPLFRTQKLRDLWRGFDRELAAKPAGKCTVGELRLDAIILRKIRRQQDALGALA